jgi:glycosyltransferase involved in cell wall biosynthesis
VGGGPLEAALTAQVGALGIADAVHLLGFRTDVSDLLPLFDVYVLPSRMEGLSLALLEAMAASLPVVVTRVGGNPEVVVDGVTGLLVEPGEPGPLAAALGALLDDRCRIANGGREHVHERFDMGAWLTTTCGCTSLVRR